LKFGCGFVLDLGTFTLSDGQDDRFHDDRRQSHVGHSICSVATVANDSRKARDDWSRFCRAEVANTLVPTFEQTEEEYRCQNVMLLGGGIEINTIEVGPTRRTWSQ
jgi:hypothetical protein